MERSGDHILKARETREGGDEWRESPRKRVNERVRVRVIN